MSRRWIGFSSPLSRGGWLVVVNCAGWALFMTTRRYGPEWFWRGVLYVVGVPLAVPLAKLLPPGAAGGVLTACLVGLNSVVWGYGLSWAWAVTAGRRRQRRHRALGLCASCAYDLAGNESGDCPECGTPTGATA